MPCRPPAGLFGYLVRHDVGKTLPESYPVQILFRVHVCIGLLQQLLMGCFCAYAYPSADRGRPGFGCKGDDALFLVVRGFFL